VRKKKKKALIIERVVKAAAEIAELQEAGKLPNNENYHQDNIQDNTQDKNTASPSSLNTDFHQ
jgi:hypothetical protein